MIDRKLEPLVKRQMIKYIGELEDDDLVMFVLEHMKDHKGPHKLVEGLEPVRVSCHLRPPAILPSRVGLGRRSFRARYQCLATGYLREYGLRRRAAHGTSDGGLASSGIRDQPWCVSCKRWFEASSEMGLQKIQTDETETTPRVVSCTS